MSAISLREVQRKLYAGKEGPPLLPHGIDREVLQERHRAKKRRKLSHETGRSQEAAASNGKTHSSSSVAKGSATAPAFATEAPTSSFASAALDQLLPASELPAGFPPELAFRALAAYATIRTLSLKLRISPFTPVVFLRALHLPVPTRLLGNIHVALLRLLLPNLGLHYHWGAASGTHHHGHNSSTGSNLKRFPWLPNSKKRRLDGLRWPLRAGDNLEHLDLFTWPTFFDDYAHLTADILHWSAVGPPFDELNRNVDDPKDNPNIWKNLDISTVPEDWVNPQEDWRERKNPRVPTLSVLYLNDDEPDDDSDEEENDFVAKDEDEEFDEAEIIEKVEFDVPRKKRKRGRPRKSESSGASAPAPRTAQNNAHMPSYSVQTSTRPMQNARTNANAQFSYNQMQTGNPPMFIPNNQLSSNATMMSGNRYGSATTNQANQSVPFPAPSPSNSGFAALLQKAMLQQAAAGNQMFANALHQQQSSPPPPLSAPLTSPVPSTMQQPAKPKNRIGRRSLPTAKAPSGVRPVDGYIRPAEKQVDPKKEAAADILESYTAGVNDAVATAEKMGAGSITSPKTCSVENKLETVAEADKSTMVAAFGTETVAADKSNAGEEEDANMKQDNHSEQIKEAGQSTMTTEGVSAKPFSGGNSDAGTSDTHLKEENQSELVAEAGVLTVAKEVATRPVAVQKSDAIMEDSNLKNGIQSEQPAGIDVSTTGPKKIEINPITAEESEAGHEDSSLKKGIQSEQVDLADQTTMPIEKNIFDPNATDKSGLSQEDSSMKRGGLSEPAPGANEPTTAVGGIDTGPGAEKSDSCDDGPKEVENPYVWSHFDALRELRKGKAYHQLSVEQKLEILEYLIDEVLNLIIVADEMTFRYNAKEHYEVLFGELPKKEELDELVNDDECAVCLGDGDLLCCDGCPSSYHQQCIDLPDHQSLPEGKWFCPECVLADPAKFGPLREGPKSSVDWFKWRDLKHPSEQLNFGTMMNDTLGDKINDDEYLVIHGFVFQRRRLFSSRIGESPNAPRILSKPDLETFLHKVGMEGSKKWPIAQIPLESSITGTISASSYFSNHSTYDPNVFANKYCRVPPLLAPKRLVFSQLKSVEEECYKMSTFPLSDLLTRSMRSDVRVFERQASSNPPFSEMAIAINYARDLQQKLLKALLIRVPYHFWISESFPGLLAKASSMKSVCRLLVLLVDCTHARAFTDEWFETPSHKPIEKTDARKKTDKIILCDDSTPELEVSRRNWQCMQAGNVVCALSKSLRKPKDWIQKIRPDLEYSVVSKSKRKRANELVKQPAKFRGMVDFNVSNSPEPRVTKLPVAPQETEEEDEEGYRFRSRQEKNGEAPATRKEVLVNVGKHIEKEQQKLVSAVLGVQADLWISEPNWPVAGRRLFEPIGELPRDQTRRLARRAGSVRAPFVAYFRLFEVGQTSCYHIWRKHMLACANFEDLLMGIRTVATFVDSDALRQGASAARKYMKKTATNSDIYCSHTDISSGEQSYLILDKSRKFGTWVPARHVEVKTLVPFQSQKIAEVEARRREKIAQAEALRRAQLLKNSARKTRPSPPALSNPAPAIAAGHAPSAPGSVNELLSSHNQQILRLFWMHPNSAGDEFLQARKHVRSETAVRLRQPLLAVGANLDARQTDAFLASHEKKFLESMRLRYPTVLGKLNELYPPPTNASVQPITSKLPSNNKNPKQNKSLKRKEYKCRNCHRTGHNFQNCPEKAIAVKNVPLPHLSSVSGVNYQNAKPSKQFHTGFQQSITHHQMKAVGKPMQTTERSADHQRVPRGPQPSHPAEPNRAFRTHGTHTSSAIAQTGRNHSQMRTMGLGAVDTNGLYQQSHARKAPTNSTNTRQTSIGRNQMSPMNTNNSPKHYSSIQGNASQYSQTKQPNQNALQMNSRRADPAGPQHFGHQNHPAVPSQTFGPTQNSFMQSGDSSATNTKETSLMSQISHLLSSSSNNESARNSTTHVDYNSSFPISQRGNTAGEMRSAQSHQHGNIGFSDPSVQTQDSDAFQNIHQNDLLAQMSQMLSQQNGYGNTNSAYADLLSLVNQQPQQQQQQQQNYQPQQQQQTTPFRAQPNQQSQHASSFPNQYQIGGYSSTSGQADSNNILNGSPLRRENYMGGYSFDAHSQQQTHTPNYYGGSNNYNASSQPYNDQAFSQDLLNDFMPTPIDPRHHLGRSSQGPPTMQYQHESPYQQQPQRQGVGQPSQTYDQLMGNFFQNQR